MQTIEELMAHYKEVRTRLGCPPSNTMTVVRIAPPKPKPVPKPEPVVEEVKEEQYLDAFGAPMTPAQIVIYQVAKKHKLKVKDLISYSRLAPLILARQEACYRLCTELNMSLNQAGRVMGKRDHTTILNAVVKHKKYLAKSSELEARQVVSDGCAERAETQPT